MEQQRPEDQCLNAVYGAWSANKKPYASVSVPPVLARSLS